MALSPKKLALFLTLAFLSIFHTHARDSQFFNKVPSTTNTNVVPTGKQPHQQEPEFLPEDESNYGLYGHESGQLPPSATEPRPTDSNQPSQKYLPMNYNPVAYVTVPEDTNDSVAEPTTRTITSPTTSESAQPLPKYLPKNYNSVAYVTVPEGTDNEESTNPNNNKDDDKSSRNYFNSNDDNDDDSPNYFNSQQEQERAYRSYPTTVGNSNYNYNSRGGGGGSFNGATTGIWPEGMSDTRSLEKGKYFYDVGAGKFSNRHPYESLRRNQGNYNGISDNNNYGGQFSTEDFQNAEKYNGP